MPDLSRRNFLKTSALLSLGFTGLQALGHPASSLLRPSQRGYGPLLRDREGILDLPRHFSYSVISRQGGRMSDGFFVPGRPDGMATFPSKNGKTLLLRNHELDFEMREEGPFGPEQKLLRHAPRQRIYDIGPKGIACPGGVTTLVYDTQAQRVEDEFLSLSGTLRNCAGGPTPWNSWITCEETVDTPCVFLSQYHGYNFEVPASERQSLAEPYPLRDMGRFNHEAVALDPRTGIVYQTEDRSDGLIYRFLPHEYGKLAKGGRLQALALLDQPSHDMRNWDEGTYPLFPRQTRFAVRWIDLAYVDSPADDLRFRGFEQGAARFARGEGAWFGQGECFFACTNGGPRQQGQIFRYRPSPFEGSPREREQPGTLELFVESDTSRMAQFCDNLTIGPCGDLVVCEDRENARIMGISLKGEEYVIAENVGYASEFSGAAFSPDGSTLFVNIQHAGLTLAITGPWAKIHG
jgi:hypothetical protein